MSEELWTDVDRYISEALVAPDAALNAALEDSAAAGLPSIHVSPNQGKLLMLLARAHRARRILEIGTLGGYSTIWLARSLVEGGRVVTLELSASYAAVAANNLARAGLREMVEIRTGDARASLTDLLTEGQPPFDFIFIDADKENYPGYFESALRLSRPGTMIIADNVVRKGSIVDSRSEDLNVQGVQHFYKLLRNESRVIATAIQTVGSKGHDGFAIALVTGM